MKYLALTLTLILVYSIAEIDAATDTTYSTIRVKKKKKSTTQKSSSTSKSSYDDDDDDPNCFDVVSGCFELLGLFADIGTTIAENREEREREKATKSVDRDTSTVTISKVYKNPSSTLPAFQVEDLQKEQYNSYSVDSALQAHRGKEPTHPKRRRLTSQEKQSMAQASLSSSTSIPLPQMKIGQKAANNRVNSSYFKRPIHLKIGISSGAGFFEDNIAYGAHLGIPISLNWHPISNFGLRLYTEPSIEGSVMEADFVRDMFVNGTHIGVQNFISDSYYSLITPARIDLLLFPKTTTNSFHFILGAGVAYTSEETEGLLWSSNSKKHITATSHDWNPTVHVGLGWQINKASLEMGYDYLATENSGQRFTPADNSRFRGKFTTSVSIALF